MPVQLNLLLEALSNFNEPFTGYCMSHPDMLEQSEEWYRERKLLESRRSEATADPVGREGYPSESALEALVGAFRPTFGPEADLRSSNWVNLITGILSSKSVKLCPATRTRLRRKLSKLTRHKPKRVRSHYTVRRKRTREGDRKYTHTVRGIYVRLKKIAKYKGIGFQLTLADLMGFLGEAKLYKLGERIVPAYMLNYAILRKDKSQPYRLDNIYLEVLGRDYRKVAKDL